MKEKFKSNYIKVFLISLIIFLLVFLIFNRLFFKSFCYAGFYDRFMDFFNSIRDAKNKDVYKQGVIYPPFINCIYFLISLIMPKKYVNTSFEDRMLFLNSTYGIVVYFILTIIVLIVLFFIIYCGFKEEKKLYRVFIFLTILFSMPVVWSIERGNSILFTTVCLIGFVLFKDSDNVLLKHLSFILLAIASAIKLFPILYALILLLEKKYKDFLIASLYISLFILVPFIFYGFNDGLVLMIKNIFKFNGEKNLTVKMYATSLQGFFIRFGITIPSIIQYILYILLFILLYFCKKNWSRFFVVTAIILNLGSSQTIYCSIYLFIPFIALLKEKKMNLFEYSSGFLFCLVFFLNAIPVYSSDRYLDVDMALPVLVWEKLMFPLMIVFYVVVVIDVVIYYIEKKNKVEYNEYLEEFIL